MRTQGPIPSEGKGLDDDDDDGDGDGDDDDDDDNITFSQISYTLFHLKLSSTKVERNYVEVIYGKIQ